MSSSLIKGTHKILSKDISVNKIQDNLDKFFEGLRKVNILNGTLIKNVDLTTGSANRIEHKLDRIPEGYIVVKKNAVADIYDNSTGTRQDLFLDLNTTANVTISIWIF